MEIPEDKPDNPWAILSLQATALDDELAPPTLQEIQGEIAPTKTEPEIETAELLAPVIAITAEVFAPNWQLTKDEVTSLATVYGALVDKYLPDNPASKYGLEITALMTTAMIFAARKGMPMKLEEKQVNEPELVKEKQEKKPIESDVYIDTNLANTVEK